LIALLKDADKRKALGEHGRDFVMKRYSKERLVKDMQLLYKDLCSRKLKR
jgi:glycosyltransferase involved in cell wall biosynthesis